MAVVLEIVQVMVWRSGWKSEGTFGKADEEVYLDLPSCSGSGWS